MGAPSDEYVRLLGLFSHEYFHAWVVKRLKPAAFTPYDLFAETTRACCGSSRAGRRTTTIYCWCAPG